MPEPIERHFFPREIYLIQIRFASGLAAGQQCGGACALGALAAWSVAVNSKVNARHAATRIGEGRVAVSCNGRRSACCKIIWRIGWPPRSTRHGGAMLRGGANAKRPLSALSGSLGIAQRRGPLSPGMKVCVRRDQEKRNQPGRHFGRENSKRVLVLAAHLPEFSHLCLNGRCLQDTNNPHQILSHMSRTRGILSPLLCLLANL